MDPITVAARERLEEQLDELSPFIPAVDAPSRSRWNDKYFEQHYFADCKIPEEIKLSSSLNAAGAFLNWYVSGETSENLCDLWLGVVYGMRLPSMDQTLISTDVWMDKSATETLKLPASVTRIAVLSYENTEHPHISAERVQKWYDILFNILESKKNDATAAAEKQYLVNYVGFLALKLLRLCVGEPESVSNHIFNETTNDFSKLWGKNVKISATYPPHSWALEQFVDGFKRHGQDTNKCLAALVYSYGKAPKQHRDEVRNILNVGCLSALENVGLGWVEWTQKAAGVLNIDVFKLLDHMNCYPANNVNILRRLFKENQNGQRMQYSLPWAAVLKAGTFMELESHDDNVYTTTMMAIVVNCDPLSPMWKIPQFQRVSNFMKHKSLNLAKSIMDVNRAEKSRMLEIENDLVQLWLGPIGNRDRSVQNFF